MRGCIARALEVAGCAESAAAGPASLLDQWMAGELDAREDHAVREHLSRCADCAREVAWLRSERALFDERSRFDGNRPPDFAAVMAAFEGRQASIPKPPVPAAARRYFGDRRMQPARAARRDRPMSPTKPAASMIALGLCAAAALFCVLLPQQSPPVRVAPDVPATHPTRQVAAPRVAPGRQDVPSPDDVQAASLLSSHDDGSCQPLASFDDGRERRVPAAAAPRPRDDEPRVCSMEDEQSAAGALICGPTEL